jgi:hypothetical protein
MESLRPTARMILVIVVMAVAETAWALYAAETSLDLLLFYAVLVAASAVFFVPGLAVVHSGAPAGRPAEAPETKG